MNESKYQEIEAKFLEIDVQKIIERLKELGAEDKGTETLHETIFYDQAGIWAEKERKMVRIRDTNGTILVTYKHQQALSATGVTEIQFTVQDKNVMKEFLLGIGLVVVREQEKRRHTFELGSVAIDIDYWPLIPPYLEIEGPTEADIRQAAGQLNLDWNDAVFLTTPDLAKQKYNLEIDRFHFFTFDKVA